MEFFYSSVTGGIHSGSAIVALVAGALVFRNTKGTQRHKTTGYVYVVSMLTLNLTAVFLQNLFGGFGWFHLFILMSLPNLLVGMYFPLFARRNPKWQVYHFEFMSWSYVGLLAGFVAEVIVRVPLAMNIDLVWQLVAAVFGLAALGSLVGYKAIAAFRIRRFG